MAESIEKQGLGYRLGAPVRCAFNASSHVSAGHEELSEKECHA